MDIIEAIDEATRDIKAESRKRLQAISARADEERDRAWSAYHRSRPHRRFSTQKALRVELARIVQRKAEADQAEVSARHRACRKVARELRARLASS